MTEDARLAAWDTLFAAVRALQPNATREDIPGLLVALEGVSAALDRVYAAGFAAGINHGLLTLELRLDRRDPTTIELAPAWCSIH